MRVLHVTGEVAPFSKTGGLGDVLGALPAAQRALGLHVEVLTPLYGFVRRQGLIAGETYDFHLASHTLQARLWRTPDAHVTFVDIPGLLDRSVPYGEFADNPLRFGAFCKVASIVARRDFDVVNLHDWQAAATAIYLGRSRPVVQTIHNLAYQGLCGFHWADALEIPHALRGYDGLEFHGHMSLFKAGLVLADRITTVSPRYAREILTEPGGQQLSGLLSHRAHDLRGILNGIDAGAWDPMHDPHLRHPFDAAHLDARAANRDALLAEAGLPPTGGPVFGVVSRATWQKGLDLVADVLPSSHLWHSRFVMLADGDHDLIARFRGLAHGFPDRVSIRMGFDEGYARRIYGGADFILVPSRFEPCGLTQMFGMRYGAIPVVRETGGLADTVRDGETGLSFFDPNPGALHHALERAVALHDAPETERVVRRAGMAQDWSWAGPAREYARLYAELIGVAPPV
jgi:starch synthase